MISKSLSEFACGFGRMEKFEIGGTSLRMILIKNPAGCNQVLNFLTQIRQSPSVFVCLPQRPGAGRQGRQLDLGRGLRTHLPPWATRLSEICSSPASARTIWRCASNTQAFPMENASKSSRTTRPRWSRPASGRTSCRSYHADVHRHAGAADRLSVKTTASKPSGNKEGARWN